MFKGYRLSGKGEVNVMGMEEIMGDLQKRLWVIYRLEAYSLRHWGDMMVESAG